VKREQAISIAEKVVEAAAELTFARGLTPDTIRQAMKVATAKGRLLYALDLDPDAEAFAKLAEVDGIIHGWMEDLFVDYSGEWVWEGGGTLIGSGVSDIDYRHTKSDSRAAFTLSTEKYLARDYPQTFKTLKDMEKWAHIEMVNTESEQ